ncbi:Alpha-L-arabinofuranosidase [Diaporthe eres]|nr:Alpha-L-arabinofuranosidase [Diaporthe eres]
MIIEAIRSDIRYFRSFTDSSINRSATWTKDISHGNLNRINPYKTILDGKKPLQPAAALPGLRPRLQHQRLRPLALSPRSADTVDVVGCGDSVGNRFGDVEAGE